MFKVYKYTNAEMININFFYRMAHECNVHTVIILCETGGIKDNRYPTQALTV